MDTVQGVNALTLEAPPLGPRCRSRHVFLCKKTGPSPPPWHTGGTLSYSFSFDSTVPTPPVGARRESLDRKGGSGPRGRVSATTLDARTNVLLYLGAPREEGRVTA